MTQRSSGLYSLLYNPYIYTKLMRILGSEKSTRRFVKEFVRPFPGCRILDIGCGPAVILKFLPEDTIYHGFDASEVYIDATKKNMVTEGFLIALWSMTRRASPETHLI